MGNHKELKGNVKECKSIVKEQAIIRKVNLKLIREVC
jgi:hypothetical protein